MGNELTNWFEKEDWKMGFDAMPDSSIHQKAFAGQFHLNKKAWEKAFAFLSQSNLLEMESGKYEILGYEVFAMIQEYTTKDLEMAKPEAHKKYADIQYVINGEELMGLADLADAEITIPYDETKDVYFLDSDKLKYYKASARNFFIFLPGDVHQPCVKVSENAPVKKVVIKVAMK